MPPTMAWEAREAPEAPPASQRAPKRRRALSFRSGSWNAKRRPSTPVTAFSESSGGQGVRQTLKQAGKVICKAAEQLVPARWRGRGTSSQPEEPSSSSSAPAQAGSPVFRPTYLSIEREAAAVSAGVDLFTYNLMMDLQHREITPEDYDTLRRLDSSIAPKTLTPATLNAISPAWRIPNPGRPLAGGHVPALRLRVMTRRSVREAGTASATGAAPSASAGEAGEDDPNNLTQSCCICIDRFCAGHRVRRLPCKHLFHATCIDEWLTTSSDICPECQQPVSTAS